MYVEPEPPPTGQALAAFLVCTFGWMFFVGLGSAVVLILANPELDPASVGGAITPRLMAYSATAQAVGMGLIASFLSRTFGPQRIYAFWSWPWILAAALAGLVVGQLPSWIATLMVDYVDAGTMQALSAAIQDADPLSLALLTFAICIAAPFCEELAFRGYVWHQLEWVMPRWMVWLVTSVLFAAYHLDPVQATALLPTALFLGYLRYASHSIWPSVMGHFTNNAIAMAGMLGWSPLPPASPWSALAGTLATVACCSAAWFWTRGGR